MFAMAKSRPNIFAWDMCNGISPVEEATGWKVIAQILTNILGPEEFNPPSWQDKGEVKAFKNQVKSFTMAPGAVLEFIKSAPSGCLFIMSNVNWFMENEGVRQSLWNLRDLFKSKGCTLIIMGITWVLPRELKSDVLTISHPLPTDEEIQNIVELTWDDAFASIAKEERPKIENIESVVDALTGLNSFGVEQVFSLSIKRKTVDMKLLRSQKIMELNRTPGLSVFSGPEVFATIGGCSNIKDFMGKLLLGKRRPRIVVFIDEIEKHFAGTGTDMSGVTTSLTGYLLSWMQDNEIAGMIFIGPPGAAKSAMAKATGNEAKILTAQLDFAGMKASYVGESEARLRYGLQVVLSMARQNILFVATCNSISALPPELRRRFTFGTFFFDLPDEDERNAIWKIYKNKWDIPSQELGFDDTGWTGAEIRQCCFNAYNLEIPLKEASSYVVPVAISAKDRIESLRRGAHGKYISASYPGYYKYPEMKNVETSVESASGRLFESIK
jgi:hypothetical protein